MTPTLKIDRAGPVARVFLDRPDVRNAFNDSVIAGLTAAFTGFAADGTLRAVVLGGHGKAFCAGADLSWMRAMADYTLGAEPRRRPGPGRHAATRSGRPVPVIVRVHGDCYAGGVGLAAACDIVVAAEGDFCLSEARLDLLPATLGPYVVKALGEQAARRYFTTAEALRRGVALRAGLRARSRAADALDAKVDELVAALVANGLAAVQRLQEAGAGRRRPPHRRHPAR